MNRRSFVTRSAAFATTLLSVRVCAQTVTPAPAVPKSAEPERGAQIAPATIKEFVVAGHANIPRVKEMLAVQPALINASWDWGSGDFECALNGASHLGRRDMALLLLEHGARLDAPCAAMLGETEMIRALIRLAPLAANSRGAHGFSLLYHAAYSGKVAIAEVLAPHLKTRGHDCNQALIPASLSGQTDFVAWLLSHGVDNPNQKNFQGKTPLDLATEGKHSDLMELLRKAGAFSAR